MLPALHMSPPTYVTVTPCAGFQLKGATCDWVYELPASRVQFCTDGWVQFDVQ
jgi:hypothetical protein